MTRAADLAPWIAERLLARNAASRRFFGRHAEPLARAGREMADRFQRGGRLLAFGRGACATDAQHVAVEFVHPVIVGKRALPALDLSPAFAPWLDALVGPHDMAMGFAGPAGDARVAAALARAQGRGALVFALPDPAAAGSGADANAGAYTDGALRVAPPAADPRLCAEFVCQELVEVLYHTLWETVHVFFEHHEEGHEVGASAFLYPFLGRQRQDTDALLGEVAASIEEKAADDERLRERVAADHAPAMAAAALAIDERLAAGGKLIAFGNGGSATDANDLMLDCVAPPGGSANPMAPVAAVSLAMESATISALANDVGAEVVFSRQLIALADAADVAVAFSTSGGSRNIVTALEEARVRGLCTVALLGDDGGEVVRRDLADFALVVPSDYIPRIQEVHASIYHVLRGALEEVRGDRDGR